MKCEHLPRLLESLVANASVVQSVTLLDLSSNAIRSQGAAHLAALHACHGIKELNLSDNPVRADMSVSHFRGLRNKTKINQRLA